MKYLFISIILLSLYSCSIQKRHHLNGYSITFHKKNKFINSHTNSSDVVKTKESIIKKEFIDYDSENLSASTDKNNSFLKDTKTTIFDEECDKIILRNGEIILAKVLGVSGSEINYKKCDDVDGLKIKIVRNTVKKIEYKNGYTEEFKDEEEVISSPIYNQKKSTVVGTQKKRLDSFSWIGLTLSLLGIATFFSAFLGIIFGIISLIKIRRSEGAFSGIGLAIAAIIVGVVIVIIGSITLL